MKSFVYRRAGTSCWWIAYYDETGKRRQRSSKTDDEALARKVLASLERKAHAARAAGVDSDDLTVAKYAERWLKDRELRGVASWKDDKGRLAHALPSLGAKPIETVKPGDVRSFMAELRARGELAPRTVRHVYGVLRVMFSDALAEELIRSTPCILKERRGEIPKKQDADLSWRDGAIFSRPEVERLIFDPRIPADRRTIYAMLFLGGMRIGEVAARTWADWNRDVRPLTGLSVLTSFNRKLKKVKGVKTDRPRYVPVHPALAALLSEWLEMGWEQQHGRHPEPHDLIVPSRTGKHLRDPVVLERLQADLAALGLRSRRVHDARRTFVSLLQADGADREKVRWVSHGPPGDILGGYTSLPWDSLCAEVAKLKLVTVQLQPPPGKEKAPRSQGLGGFFGVPRAGFEAGQDPILAALREIQRPPIHVVAEHIGPGATPGEPPRCNTVTDPRDPTGVEALARREGFLVWPPSEAIH